MSFGLFLYFLKLLFLYYAEASLFTYQAFIFESANLYVIQNEFKNNYSKFNLFRKKNFFTLIAIVCKSNFFILPCQCLTAYFGLFTYIFECMFYSVLTPYNVAQMWLEFKIVVINEIYFSVTLYPVKYFYLKRIFILY